MTSQPNHDSNPVIRLDGQPDVAPLPTIPAVQILDLNSDDPLPAELVRPPQLNWLGQNGSSPTEARGKSENPRFGVLNAIWRNGDVLMCACPDCRAPMSIRTWLMIADCWQCGLSIELTEEQEREARRLMAGGENRLPAALPPKSIGAPPADTASRQPTGTPSSGVATAAAASQQTLPSGQQQAGTQPSNQQQPGQQQPATQKTDAQRSDPQRSNQRSSQQPPSSQSGPTERLGATQTPPRPRRPAAAQRTRARLQRAKRRSVSAWLSDALGTTPAWLISLIFHLILLALMALLFIGHEQADPYITLSTTVSKDVHEGGDTLLVDPQNELAFDLPLPRDIDANDQVQLEAIVKANQDAKQLRVDPDAPNLPELDQVKQLIGGKTGITSALAARDPRVRVEMVKQEGGTTLSEAAVARGLRWLSQHQNADGSWSLDRYNRSSGCTCTVAGMRSTSAGTSLALLPFLGAGQTHLVGHYRESVARALRWLISHQQPNGDLRTDSAGNSGMYAQGQCAIVLCEAYFMTGDEELRVPAQRAIDFIVDAQHGAGGWRYKPGEPGDTSVFGWQLMALQSARAANLNVPDETLTLASHYLDSVQSNDGAQYAYQRGGRADHVMTAEALLCRMYLGWTKSDPGLQRGMNLLAASHLPDTQAPNIYYWYYATQAFHHVGDANWDRWNRKMRTILVDSQVKRGHAAGSWDPQHRHDRNGGRIYATALATCTLEVYYRHLPIFRQIELE